MNYFEQFLSQTSPQIQKSVNQTLHDWSLFVKKQAPNLITINKKFTNSFHGGKYIRGALVYLGFELFNKKQNLTITNIASAFEILHTSLLIHDDIIDQSPSRRGKPALHVLFNNPQYGLSQAICFGDLGLYLAIKIISDTKITPVFSEIVIQTILGQMLDIHLTYEKTKKESHILMMQKLKTAYYTLSGPLTIGAMLGNAKKKNIEALKDFGESLGLAYQIQDDILGVFGDEKLTGKSTTNDIQENKNTLLIAYALKKANADQKKLLNKYYGKKSLTKKNYEIIKNIFIATGALSYSQKKAETFTKKALTSIPYITKNKKHQKILIDFTSFIISRKK